MTITRPAPGKGQAHGAAERDVCRVRRGQLHRTAAARQLRGKFVHFGKNVYANFNLTLVDDTHIYVGDCTMFGPNVTVATAGHPILPQLRAQGYQYNASVHIGKNCWIGAGAILLPGVTLGDNVVVGAGSVVTKDRARQCGGGGQSLPGAAAHHRQRPGILLQTASHRPGTSAMTRQKRPAFPEESRSFGMLRQTFSECPPCPWRRGQRPGHRRAGPCR